MQEAVLQIYGEGRNRVYEKELKRLKKEKISQHNKELITEFHNYLFAKGTKELRVSKLSGQLRFLANKLGKDFDKATKKDVQSLIAFVNRNIKFAEATKSDYRRCIKQLYLWIKENDDRVYSNNQQERIQAHKFYKFVEKEISIAYKKKLADPSTIVTEEDIDLVVSKGCRSIKEKAFLKFLHETGVRAGELLNIKIKNVVIKESYAKVLVDGKTGKREVPIVHCLPYLTAWLDLHPYKDNLNTYVWLGENPRNMWQPLKHCGAQKLINRCFEAAGLVEKEYSEVTLESGKRIRKLLNKTVKKKHNLHWFRHSRATLLAPYLTEALLCKYMGWVPGSRQIKVYVHLCNQQLDDAYLRINGLKQEKQEQQKPKLCSCKAVNPSNNRYCYRCGKPQSVEIAIQDQELVKSETDKSVQLLMEIAQNPELMKQFLEFKRDWER